MGYYSLAFVATPFVLIAVLLLLNRFYVTDEDRKKFEKAQFLKKDLPKIWKKYGFDGIFWTPSLKCPYDGSVMHLATGAWHKMYGDDSAATNAYYLCPTCGASMWHECDSAGLNSFRPPNKNV